MLVFRVPLEGRPAACQPPQVTYYPAPAWFWPAGEIFSPIAARPYRNQHTNYQAPPQRVSKLGVIYRKDSVWKSELAAGL
jgi:hypothetical protein